MSTRASGFSRKTAVGSGGTTTALVPAIRNFVKIYRGTQQASYVEVPVSVN
jgi:hypothetical protein